MEVKCLTDRWRVPGRIVGDGLFGLMARHYRISILPSTGQLFEEKQKGIEVGMRGCGDAGV